MNLKGGGRQKYFIKNLRFLHKTYPDLAYQLERVDPSDLEFCQTDDNELNLKRFYNGKCYYYHSSISALKEAHEWFRSLDLCHATVIFNYGVGLGYYYQAAKEWLRQHPYRMLVFLEEDLGILHRLCETELGVNLLKDPQVRIAFFQDNFHEKEFFNELSWTYLRCHFIITALKMYQRENSERYTQLAEKLQYNFENKKSFVDEYLKGGVVFFRNFYPNILELPKAYYGNGLFKCFSQVPAIICGAGPSLSKNIHLLHQLKKKALIFCGGSALHALIPKGIIPHFGVAIDPNKAQYSRVAVAQSHNIPFFYRGRLFHEAFTAIKGPRLYLTGAGNYSLPNWFEKQLKIEGTDLDEGHNVVNFSIQIAQALGCNPIILVGVDLAFTDQRFYAQGISENLKLVEEDLKKKEEITSHFLERKDMYGNRVQTMWKWLMEADWISQFSKNHPEITIVNATEGGMGFEGIANITLQECIAQFLSKSKEEIDRIDETILKHPLSHIKSEDIVKLFYKMKESLDRCIFLCSKWIENNSILSPLQTSSTVLFETELEETVAYQWLLETFNQIYLLIYRREFQEAQLSVNRKNEKKKALKRHHLETQRLIFLRDVANVHQKMILYHLEKRTRI